MGATTDDVVRAAVAVFGDSAVVAAADSATDEPTWDLDVRSYETHDRVEYYVDLFSNRAKERFTARMSRGTRYEPMIRAKLRASGMPEDLTYLALIESGYDPHAYSRAAAVGVWQFMSSTARDVGMRVDWWVDERRDPARATDGAIRFLGYLQRQFGSFYLAAAAYNGGPGRVSRGLTRFADELEGMAGEDRFFALADQDYLRAETKNYVPQLIAAALVAKMPTKYGLTIDSLPPYEYDSVRVAPGTSLSAVATAGGVPATELRDLNPALLRGVVPPDAALWVRVPVGRAERTAAALDSMPDEQARGYRTVRVGESVTPTSFAATHGVSVKHLRWFNPVVKTTKRGRLVAGQSLRIPEDAALTYARDIPDPSLEKFGGAGGRTIAPVARRPCGEARGDAGRNRPSLRAHRTGAQEHEWAARDATPCGADAPDQEIHNRVFQVISRDIWQRQVTKVHQEVQWESRRHKEEGDREITEGRLPQDKEKEIVS
ncbi:transglycosylase SLT domain-containing protein [Gemmatimonas sp.]|uniref:lytic transglycosylase domain-containing protein n=1 Tax=Gemmatimonas sp. TaxID=1962908 RepID=UPI003DA4B848